MEYRCGWTWILAASFALFPAQAHADMASPIAVSTGTGMAVPLQPEKLQGLKTRPLAKLKEAMDRRFGAGFLSLHKIGVKDGTELVGRCRVTSAPLRLTVYEVSRKKGDGQRALRVVASGFFAQPGELGEFRTTVQGLEEDLFFVTAEQVESADELNSHLAYMNTQDNSITVKGFSSNWNLSVLKVNLAGKDAANQEVPFTKDAEWLVNRLIRPLWVMSIRIDTKS